MKKILIVAIALSSFTIEVFANDNLYITCNKSSYVVGEQVVFDVTRFRDGLLFDDESESPVFIDLVAPGGEIVQSKSMIIREKDCYFFSLSDTLKTGIYRLIANSKDSYESVKRIHVFALDLAEQDQRNVANIEYKVDGGALINSQLNKVVVRATDIKGAGISTKGTLVNGADSLIQYLDTDPNGLIAFEFFPSDSLYKVRFGKETLDLKPKVQPLFSRVLSSNEAFTVQVLNPLAINDSLSVLVDGVLHSQFKVLPENDSLEINIEKKGLSSGIHVISLESMLTKRQHVLMNKPSDHDKKIQFDSLGIKNNEQVEMVLEDSADLIDHLTVSIIDKEQAYDVNFYEDYYFDQAGFDLLVVQDRDFSAYVTFFGNDVKKKVNQQRMSAIKKSGVLKYRYEFPFDELSMLNLTTMKVFDVRCENIYGIADFEKVVSGRSQVFPYHFTTYLQPIDLADFDESVDHKYPSLQSSISLSEKEVALVKSFDMQRNIVLSYKAGEKDKASLPKPDFVYELENFDIPNTMVDMINYIVKYVSVVKNSDDNPELSMYRYMSTYKYRGGPLMFLNNLPVYNAQTILNLNPKDFERVEVRNSYEANSHLGNFSLNGSVSFYLKEGVDNPLEKAYKNLPVLESCRNFNKRLSDNEHAPDFRHQLYWNPKVLKTKNSFWIDLKSSDLSATYDVQVTAYLKDGTVVNGESKLTVK